MNRYFYELSPLSSAQEMVFLEQLVDPDSRHFNLSFKFKIKGNISLSRITAALQDMAQALPALRTRILQNDDGVFQTFRPVIELPLTVFDCTDALNKNQNSDQIIQQKAEQKFDLFGDILWRVVVNKLGQQAFDIGIVYHHIIADGFCYGLLTQAFVESYNRAPQADLSSIDPPLAYLAFIAQSNTYLHSSSYQRDQQFWHNEFQSLPPQLLSPETQLSSETQSPQLTQRSAFHQTLLPRDCYKQLLAQLDNEGLTAQSFFIAVVAAYLHNCYGQQDIVLGIPLRNRSKASYKTLVGMFSVVQPLRVQIHRDMSFQQLVTDIHKKLKGLYRHSRYPLAELNRHLQPQLVGRAREQLFDVSVSYEPLEVDFAMADCEYRVERVPEHHLRLPLTVRISDEQKDADVEIITVSNLAYFSADIAPRLSARLAAMITSLAQSLRQPLADLVCMNTAERQQLLVEFNDTTANYPHQRCLHQLFEAQAAAQPNALALVAGEQRLSFQQLNGQANQLAHHLRALGVRPDCLVGLCVGRSAKLVIAQLAILKAGGAYVPMDPNYPEARLRQLLADSHPSVLVLDGTVPAAALLSAECGE